MTPRKTEIICTHDRLLGECVCALHKSGMKLIVYPMERSQCFASLSVDLGGADTAFELGGKKYTIPIGTAHFLEHKMFDCEGAVDGSALLAEMGAFSNAYTAECETVYLLSCTENFERCLKTFLEIFTKPYFTDESLKKELPIIDEEISMYRDMPDDRLFYTWLRAAYKCHPVRQDIAGTKRSIRTITPQLLYTVASAFYTPSNMTLSVSGNIDARSVIEICDRVLVMPQAERGRVIAPSEPVRVGRARALCHDDITMPKCTIGVKLSGLPENKAELVLLEARLRILASTIFGNSSELTDRLYSSGVISSPPIVEPLVRRGVGYLRLSVDCRDPEIFIDEFYRYIERVKAGEISEETLTACRRASYGAYIADSDSPEAMSDILSANAACELAPSDLLDCINAIDKATLTELSRTIFKKECISAAIMLPKSK